MPYGYLGQNQPNQTVSNSGVFSITDVAELQSQGKLGGSLELIESQSWTTLTNYLEFTDLKEDVYDVHLLYISGKVNGAGGSFYYRTSSNGGTSYDSTSGDYKWGAERILASGTEDKKVSGTNATALEFYGNSGAGDYARTNRYTYIYNAGDNTKRTFLTDFCTSDDTTFTGYQSTFASGCRTSQSIVNAIQFFTNAGGGFARGEAFLYGIKQL